MDGSRIVIKPFSWAGKGTVLQAHTEAFTVNKTCIYGWQNTCILCLRNETNTCYTGIEQPALVQRQ